MELARKLIQEEAEKILAKIPGIIPPESKKIIGPIAGTLKISSRMLPGFPQSDLKGLDWLFDILGTLTPPLIGSLTEEQLRAAAMKAIELGLAVLDALPPEGGEKLE